MKIKVIAPSSKAIDTSDFVEKAKQNLKKIGVDLITDKRMFEGSELPFFSSNFEFAKQDLINSLTSPEYNVIWAARGGYGAANIAVQLTDLQDIRNKTIIGFSDITALHFLFNQIYNLPTIHANVISNFMRNEDDFESIGDILNGKTQKYELFPLNKKAQSYNTISGKIQGGNLIVSCSLIGTKISPRFKNKIILFEDVNEKGYAVHRSLMHLKNAACFDGAKALILGEFNNSDEHIDLALEHFANNDINFPCFRIKAIGHLCKNLPIVFGADSEIHKNILTVNSPFNYS